MKRLLFGAGLLCCPLLCAAAALGPPARPNAGGAADFETPTRLKAGGAAVRVEAPGYAAPCLADIDGDGKPDLLVGQFNKGKVQLFKGLGKGQFAKGDWLKADGKDAEVPGVW